MAVKYGGPALKAGKKNLDKVAKRGKKTACGCPRSVGRSVEDSLAKVEQIRSNYSIGKKRNIGFAEIDVDGKKGELIGVSGRAERAGTVGVPQKRRFETITTGNNPRTLDAEMKILEELATSLSKDSKGTIYLFSERPLCVSCSDVVRQFRREFPNIELIISNGPGR